MKIAYRALAWVIAALVMAQAATEAWFASGLGRYLLEGGTIDPSIESGPPPFVEIWGIVFHSLAGMYLIPFLAVVFLLVGYLSHNRKALPFAIAVAVLVAVQVTLGVLASELTILAFFHGLNALLLFGAALSAALLVPRKTVTAEPADADDRRIVGSGV